MEKPMHLFRLALVGLGVIALSGCSYLFGNEGRFRERAMDYQKAESIPPLTVPSGMESRPLSQRYPIPSAGKAEFYVPAASDEIPKPQALVGVNEDAGIELRADGDRHWLVVDQPVERLWPQAKNFLSSNGLTLDQENVAAGVLETRWLKPRIKEGEEPGFWASLFGFSDEDLRERIRFTLSDISEQGKTVITIDHVQTRKGDDALPQAENVEWPEQPENPELVLALYNELMDFLGEGGRQVSFSVLSQDLKALPKFVMTWDGNGYPVLVINQDFNRSWQDVGQALEKARIEVEDLDRSLGIYYLKKNDPDDDEEQALQLRITRSESGIQVAVQYDDDTLAPKETSAAILNRLREALE